MNRGPDLGPRVLLCSARLSKGTSTKSKESLMRTKHSLGFLVAPCLLTECILETTLHKKSRKDIYLNCQEGAVLKALLCLSAYFEGKQVHT